jgi:flavorubredoxin
MKCNVTEIAPAVYRISTFHPEYGIQFNQFLIADDEPFLMHTGFRRMFSITREGVAAVLDPASVRWIGFSHFESDECGALNDWLKVAPHAQAVCSFVGATVSVNDFADRPARALNDNEALEIGGHRLRFLSTPHVPHGRRARRGSHHRRADRADAERHALHILHRPDVAPACCVRAANSGDDARIELPWR